MEQHLAEVITEIVQNNGLLNGKLFQYADIEGISIIVSKKIDKAIYTSRNHLMTLLIFCDDLYKSIAEVHLTDKFNEMFENKYGSHGFLTFFIGLLDIIIENPLFLIGLLPVIKKAFPKTFDAIDTRISGKIKSKKYKNQEVLWNEYKDKGGFNKLIKKSDPESVETIMKVIDTMSDHLTNDDEKTKE